MDFYQSNVRFSTIPIKFLVLPLLLLLSSCSDTEKDSNITMSQAFSPVDLVEPLLGTADSRWFYFSSASRPFGMVNLSPDTQKEGTWRSGYRYHKNTIHFFSHIHAWQLSGIPVLPTTGEFKGHLGSDQYGSRFSHDNEMVRPGFHQVYLDDYEINAELTSTTRVGFHRYTFPESEVSHILFDFSTILGPSGSERGYVKMVSDSELEGYVIMEGTLRRPKPVKVFFIAQFDKPFETFAGWQDGKLVEVSDVMEGAAIGAYVSFPTSANEERLMKVAISYVSTDQARLNQQTELAHWNFDQVIVESHNDWNRWLGRIEVEGGTEVEQRRFYTDLWKALQGRRIVNDVNGKYLDMTGDERRTGQIPLDGHGRPLFNHHSSDSFWGAQWSLNTLWHLVYPEVTEDFVNSMLMMYDDGGLIPRGPSGGNYTYVMTGASTTPFIVSAWMKGIRGFDVEKAYEGLRKNHFPGGLMSKAGYEHDTFKGGGIEYYMERGYIPHPLSDTRYGFHQDGPGQTLEYSYQDWALAQMAKSLGKQEDYEMFSDRSQNYRNIWYEEEGWMWVRDHDGQWREPFDVLEYGNGWIEGNAAHYTWWVPHDVPSLADLMGGEQAFNEKLNQSFEYGREHDFVTQRTEDNELRDIRRRNYINYGNQPCMQMAFLFNYSGAPWLTQYWTRQVINTEYAGISPDDGYGGDEDQGLMGALAVLMKIGLFSTNGGSAIEPLYEVASPIFDRITIHLNPGYYPGETFVIETTGNSPESYYIQSAELNGRPLDSPFISHDHVVNGSVLKLVMDSTPNKSWGLSPSP